VGGWLRPKKYLWDLILENDVSKPQLYFFGGGSLTNSELGKKSEWVGVWLPRGHPFEKRTSP
tara:strand:+ start:89 stop:274 length:186 start_codon:yes stop_codon:yes gene_type:complete